MQIAVTYQYVISCIIAVLFMQFVFAQANEEALKWGDWQQWGDNGNGTYSNPVLPTDFSDIDCIRVASHYYAVSSTFQYSPGFVILQSADLVNWKIISHAVTDITMISPYMNWDKMKRYGRGIWAGAIRYHAGKFYIYFGTPDEGYFMATAKKAEGPWQPLKHILNKKGWDDCCPFWDDDGKAYLVATKFNDNYATYLFRMNSTGTQIIKNTGKVIHQSNGSEANKLYKINGIYYHLFSEVKKDGRALMMERSQNIWGPYTEIKQVSYTQPEYNEPNQGGLVKTEKGNWYFLTHHGTGDWCGRVVSLLPVIWVDGWPLIGKSDKDTMGRMVWQSLMPVPTEKIMVPQTSDDFSNAALSPQWEWNYQARSSKWSLIERKGWLRLHAFQPLVKYNLLAAGNTLTQRTYRTRSNEVVVKMYVGNMSDGEVAGLSHFGSPSYSTFGITCKGAKRTIEYYANEKVVNGPAIRQNIIWLKSTWSLDGVSNYYYSLDGKQYTLFGEPYQLKWQSYRGDRIAIYNYNNKSNSGYIDIDYFQYHIKK